MYKTTRHFPKTNEAAKFQCNVFNFNTTSISRERNREIEREREQNNTIKIEELRYGAKCNSDFMNKQE